LIFLAAFLSMAFRNYLPWGRGWNFAIIFRCSQAFDFIQRLVVEK